VFIAAGEGLHSITHLAVMYDMVHNAWMIAS
jgi:hypothetical protein